MPRTIIPCILLVFSLLSCAENRWVRPGGATEEDFYADKLDCIERTNQFMAQRYRPPQGPVMGTAAAIGQTGNALSEVAIQGMFFDNCMKAKGYRLEIQ